MSYSLNEPNFISIFTNAELLPTLLKYVISDGEATEANQFILDNIRSLRAIQLEVFNVGMVASTSSHSLVLLISYEDSFLYYADCWVSSGHQASGGLQIVAGVRYGTYKL